MQLSWYFVEDNMDLVEITFDVASDIIRDEGLTWEPESAWPSCYLNKEGYPVIVQGIMGLKCL